MKVSQAGLIKEFGNSVKRHTIKYDSYRPHRIDLWTLDCTGALVIGPRWRHMAMPLHLWGANLVGSYGDQARHRLQLRVPSARNDDCEEHHAWLIRQQALSDMARDESPLLEFKARELGSIWGTRNRHLPRVAGFQCVLRVGADFRVCRWSLYREKRQRWRLRAGELLLGAATRTNAQHVAQCLGYVQWRRHDSQRREEGGWHHLALLLRAHSSRLVGAAIAERAASKGRRPVQAQVGVFK